AAFFLITVGLSKTVSAEKPSASSTRRIAAERSFVRIASPTGNSGPGWAIVTSPNTSASGQDILYGVACAAADDCWAVGSYQNALGHLQTLTERWNGER